MPFEAEQHAVPPGRMCCFAGISTRPRRNVHLLFIIYRSDRVPHSVPVHAPTVPSRNNRAALRTKFRTLRVVFPLFTGFPGNLNKISVSLLSGVFHKAKIKNKPHAMTFVTAQGFICSISVFVPEFRVTLRTGTLQ
jgi:hypothetical protein